MKTGNYCYNYHDASELRHIFDVEIESNLPSTVFLISSKIYFNPMKMQRSLVSSSDAPLLRLSKSHNASVRICATFELHAENEDDVAETVVSCADVAEENIKIQCFRMNMNSE